MGDGEGSGFPEFERNQWTVEGRIERVGAIRRSRVRAAPAGVRWFLRVVIGLSLALVAVSLIAAVVDAL